MAQQLNPGESDFPATIGQPATNALRNAGYTHLDQLTKVSGVAIKQLHGMGPKALGILQEALAAKGLDFAFPTTIGNPATSALLHAGYTELAQLTQATEAEIKQLHGMGPKALGILREALADRGLAFAPKPTK